MHCTHRKYVCCLIIIPYFLISEVYVLYDALDFFILPVRVNDNSNIGIQWNILRWWTCSVNHSSWNKSTQTRYISFMFSVLWSFTVMSCWIMTVFTLGEGFQHFLRLCCPSLVRLEILTASLLKIQLMSHVTSCHLVTGCECQTLEMKNFWYALWL